MVHISRRRAKELLDITVAQDILLDDAAARDPRKRLFLAYIAQEQDARSERGRRNEGQHADRTWIEIPCKTLRGRFGNVDWRSLTSTHADKGSIGSIEGIGVSEEPRLAPMHLPSVLLDRGYSTDLKRCRGFRLVPSFHNQYIEAGVTSVAEAKRAEWVKAETRRKSGRAKRSKTHDDNGHQHPKRPLSALKVLRYGLFDAIALEAYLTSLKEDLKGLRRAEHRVARRAAQRRYGADFYAYRGVLAQRPVEVGDGIYKYPLYYRVASSGRLYHVRGGLQSISRAAKAAAYERVGAFNYDLKAAHVAGLLQQLREAGLPSEATFAYLVSADAPGTAAAAAGISREAVKEAIYAALYGSDLLCPESASNLVHGHKENFNAAVSVISDAAELANFGQVYTAFYDSVYPVVTEMAAWRRYLADEVIPDISRTTRRRGDIYLTNAAGMARNMTRAFEGGPPYTKQQIGRYAAAHLLQGLEAAYIHALCVALDERGVVVISNEHDGIVCLEEVSEADMNRAIHESGFRGATLVLKPFV